MCRDIGRGSADGKHERLRKEGRRRRAPTNAAREQKAEPTASTRAGVHVPVVFRARVRGKTGGVIPPQIGRLKAAQAFQTANMPHEYALGAPASTGLKVRTSSSLIFWLPSALPLFFSQGLIFSLCQVFISIVQLQATSIW